MNTEIARVREDFSIERILFIVGWLELQTLQRGAARIVHHTHEEQGEEQAEEEESRRRE
jgi:hypothetical protein